MADIWDEDWQGPEEEDLSDDPWSPRKLPGTPPDVQDHREAEAVSSQAPEAPTLPLMSEVESSTPTHQRSSASSSSWSTPPADAVSLPPCAAEVLLHGTASPGAGCAHQPAKRRVAGADVEDGLPRRRLRSKTGPAAAGPPSASNLLDYVRGLFESHGARHVATKADKAHLYEVVRRLHMASTVRAAAAPTASAEQRQAERRRCRLEFPALPALRKARLYEQAVEDRLLQTPAAEACALETAARLRTQAADAEPGTPRGQRLNTHSVLLTWNGPWGLLRDETFVAQSSGSRELPVALAARHPVTEYVWQRLQDWLQDLAGQLQLRHWASCLELCPDTWEEKGQARLHAHAMLVGSQKLRCVARHAFCFGGAHGYTCDQSFLPKGRGRNAALSFHAGLYYVQAPKTGQLRAAGTKRPHKDFLVSPEWVTNLWAGGKLSDEHAVAQYVLCKKDVRRHVENVQAQSRLARELRHTGTRAADEAALAATLRRCRSVPAVDAWLLRQQTPSWRQQFLVLEGESGLGKTLFAVGLAGPDRTLQINCAATRSEPDLRDFVPGRHRAIVFDEARPSMVICQKRLFQAPTAPVQMANSTTNCFGYQVSVHGVLLIVCSNSWTAELLQLAVDEQQWLRANAVHVVVTEKLWHDT